MKLRLGWDGGNSKIKLSNDACLDDLCNIIEEVTGIKNSAQKLFGGYPPKHISATGAEPLKALGICSGDQVTCECIPGINGPSVQALQAQVGVALSKGVSMIYTPTGEQVTVTGVHHDDPPELYYTVKMRDGREKQTTASKLQEVSSPAADSVAAGAADSEWVCAICTLCNSPLVTKCNACETVRPGAVNSSAIAGESTRPTTQVGTVSRAELRKMPDDNSCLFHALCHLLDPTKTAAELREIVAVAVKSDAIRWNIGTLGKDPWEYVLFITDPKRWGGEVELAILSEHYRCELAVTEVQSGRMDVYGQHKRYPNRVYLLFSGIHFDAVELVEHNGTTNCQVCPNKTQSADVAVAALATNLRAQGAFSDRDTLRLRCKVCNQVVCGDYEARLHSGTYNHTEFVPA